MGKYCKQTFENLPEEKRARILTSATKEFAMHGFDDANIISIAKKAEVSVGSLYKYFNSKRDLFLTVIDFGINLLTAVLESIAVSDEDLLFKVEKIIREIQRFSRENSTLINLYNHMTVENNPLSAKTFASEMESVTSKIYRTAIEEGKKSGEVRSDIDSAYAAFMLDNIFMSLQFAYSCNYYRERFNVYVRQGITEPDHDNFIVAETLKFIKSALRPQDKKH